MIDNTKKTYFKSLAEKIADGENISQAEYINKFTSKRKRAYAKLLRLASSGIPAAYLALNRDDLLVLVNVLAFYLAFYFKEHEKAIDNNNIYIYNNNKILKDNNNINNRDIIDILSNYNNPAIIIYRALKFAASRKAGARFTPSKLKTSSDLVKIACCRDKNGKTWFIDHQFATIFTQSGLFEERATDIESVGSDSAPVCFDTSCPSNTTNPPPPACGDKGSDISEADGGGGLGKLTGIAAERDLNTRKEQGGMR